jgi:hypothetical protein
MDGENKDSADLIRRGAAEPFAAGNPCDDLRIDVDWQFNVNAGEGDIRRESPLYAYADYFTLCTYNQAADRVDWPPSAPDNFLANLSIGQGHEQQVQNLYRRVWGAMSLFEFAECVLRCAGGSAADFDKARVDISWQAGANAASISGAKSDWNLSNRVSDPDAKRYFRAEAMYSLLTGQRHGWREMQNYRACYRDDPSRLFEAVNAV